MPGRETHLKVPRLQLKETANKEEMLKALEKELEHVLYQMAELGGSIIFFDEDCDNCVYNYHGTELDDDGNAVIVLHMWDYKDLNKVNKDAYGSDVALMTPDKDSDILSTSHIMGHYYEKEINKYISHNRINIESYVNDILRGMHEREFMESLMYTKVKRAIEFPYKLVASYMVAYWVNRSEALEFEHAVVDVIRGGLQFCNSEIHGITMEILLCFNQA